MPRTLPLAVLALLATLTPAAPRAAAQDDPAPSFERYLPAGAQVYLRWDGETPHHEAWTATAAHDVLWSTSLGEFFDQAIDELIGAGAEAAARNLIQSGAPPDQIRQMRDALGALPALIQSLWDHGFVLAARLEGAGLPPQVEVTAVLPGAGAPERAEPLDALLRYAIAQRQVEVTQRTPEGYNQQVTGADIAGVHVWWWPSGDDFVLTAGTSGAEGVLARLAGAEPSLAHDPIVAELREAEGFPAAFAARVDVAGLTAIAATLGPESPPAQLAAFLQQTGLEDVHLQWGPAGRSLRTRIVARFAEDADPARVLGEPFELADLPPLPDDTTAFVAMNGDWSAAYGLLLRGISAVALLGPQAQDPPDFESRIDEALGLDLREDVFAHLGPRGAIYATPSEGPLGIGLGWALEVTDREAADEAMLRLIQALASAAGNGSSVDTTEFRGVKLYTLVLPNQGRLVSPTYAVSERWMIAGLYPQVVQAFLLREQGELPAWQPDGEALARIETLGADSRGPSLVYYNNPRPMTRQVLTIAPALLGLVQAQGNAEFEIDLPLIPPAAQVEQHLFPNLTGAVRDGRTLVLTSDTSIPMLPSIGEGASYLAIIFGQFLLITQ